MDSCARRYGFRLYRSSATEDFNISPAFQYLITKCVQKFPDPNEIDQEQDETDELDGSGNPIIMPSKRRTDGMKPALNRHALYNKANEIDKRCAIMWYILLKLLIIHWYFQADVVVWKGVDETLGSLMMIGCRWLVANQF